MTDIQPVSAVAAVAAVTAEIGAIGKDSQGHGYSYRGIDDMLNALSPLLAKHGVVIVPNVVDVETVAAPGRKEGWTATRSKHSFTVFGPDGSSFVGGAAADGLSNQGTGPGIAASYAYKTFVIQLFCIPTRETPEAENVPPVEYVTQKQADDLTALFDQIVDENARKVAKVDWVRVFGRPTDLPAAAFDDAYAAAMDTVEQHAGDTPPAEEEDTAAQPTTDQPLNN